MISETAGAGVIRQDVQQAIEREMRYRLGEGDAPGALSRWQKELLLLVIQTVKANACLSQLHARAAVKAGATLAQVLQVIQYVELTGMVKWVMVGHDALTAVCNGMPQQKAVETTHCDNPHQYVCLQDASASMREYEKPWSSAKGSSRITWYSWKKGRNCPRVLRLKFGCLTAQ